ncbi:Transcription factor bHLH143 [Mucuna pruriens]|uniref:Transcription factor bHLH143 n=1 Tax=Mucuna pruriens TaxID=157652 RepID=A0A371ENR9_MUCPR|nr:Transcription factor bHLH143 [Mucuna pruriens]
MVPSSLFPVHSQSSHFLFSLTLLTTGTFFLLLIHLDIETKEVMVCQAASQTRFRALKHEYGIGGERTIIVRVIACFQPLHFCQAEYFRHLLKPVTSVGHLFCWMVKADGSLPRPHHVAWQSPSNYFCMLPKPSLLGLPTYVNSSPRIFPAVSTFCGLAAPSIPSLKTELTNELQGFLQYRNADKSLKETHVGGALQNANSSSLQRKLLIFDRSDNKTRLFYGPVLPLVQSPTVTATKFAQSYDVNGEGQATNVGQKHLANYSILEESIKDHAVIEESEMHEDTEEINALLYSDDDSSEDDDDITSTDRSPLATKRTYAIEEQFEDMKEEVASSDWPNKRLKLFDGDYNRSSPPVDRSSLVRPNETVDCVSDAESKNSSSLAYSVDKTNEDDSVVCDIKLKKDKIRESLRALENLIPGAKGKEPLLVIDETIEYLKLLMSQSGALGVKYH